MVDLKYFHFYQRNIYLCHCIICFISMDGRYGWVGIPLSALPPSDTWMTCEWVDTFDKEVSDDDCDFELVKSRLEAIFKKIRVVGFGGRSQSTEKID